MTGRLGDGSSRHACFYGEVDARYDTHVVLERRIVKHIVEYHRRMNRSMILGTQKGMAKEQNRINITLNAKRPCDSPLFPTTHSKMYKSRKKPTTRHKQTNAKTEKKNYDNPHDEPFSDLQHKPVDLREPQQHFWVL